MKLTQKQLECKKLIVDALYEFWDITKSTKNKPLTEREINCANYSLQRAFEYAAILYDYKFIVQCAKMAELGYDKK